MVFLVFVIKVLQLFSERAVVDNVAVPKARSGEPFFLLAPVVGKR